MNAIVIHGPPGVGKFTVAKELADLTRYKLIHIHDIYDFLENIFTKQNYPTSLEILNNLYINILEGASKLNFEGIIFTYAEIAKNDFEFLKEVKSILNKNNSSLHAVQLLCDKEELKKRVVSESREKFHKTHTVEELEILCARKDYKSTFPEVETITINNTNITAKEVAEKIKNELF